MEQPTALDPKVFSFLNDYFDKIFVLSLRRATDRHSVLQRVLHGLQYTYFWGLDKHDLHRDDLIQRGLYDDDAARRPQFFNRHGMVLGQIACSLSHRAIYETIIREDYQRVLIFEDDVIPIESRLNQLPNALQELPPDWELLYVGYRKHEEITPKLHAKRLFYRLISHLGLGPWTPREIDRLLPKPYSIHLRRAGFHDCTHAYALTPSGARKLIQAQKPIVANADSIISTLIMNEVLNAFVTVPTFFNQTGPSYAN